MIDYLDFSPELAEKFDFVVLSGGPIGVSEYWEVEKEKEWLRNTSKPVLGICLGMEIIGVSYGNTLSSYGAYKMSAPDVNLFGQKGQIFSAHKYFFKEINDQFNVLSRNAVFIEALEHKEKPFLGVQGHPEVSGVFGQTVLEHFIKNYVQRRYISSPSIAAAAISSIN